MDSDRRVGVWILRAFSALKKQNMCCKYFFACFARFFFDGFSANLGEKTECGLV